MIIEAERRTDGFMNAVQVLEVIQTLAKSQGFYARMFRALMELKEENPNAFSAWCSSVEARNFKDSVDVVMFFES